MLKPQLENKEMYGGQPMVKAELEGQSPGELQQMRLELLKALDKEQDATARVELETKLSDIDQLLKSTATLDETDETE